MQSSAELTVMAQSEKCFSFVKMTLLALPFTTKVTLEKGLVGTMVGFMVVGLADVVDSLDNVVVVLLLGTTVKF